MDRRDFLRLGSLTSLAIGTRARATQSPQGTAYVGTADHLHVFAVRGRAWSPLQQLPCAAPACLVSHPVLPVLYVVHEVARSGENLAGAVSAWSIDRAGRLTLLQQHSLSLAATLSRSIAISPDGTHAVVAATGGGIYNLFNLNSDGSIATLRGVLKETGSGVHPLHQASSHPHHVTFNNAGNILGADLGTDRIHHLTYTDGPLQFKSKHPVQPGNGPALILLHPTAPFLAISHALAGNVTIHAYDAPHGCIGAPLHRLPGTAISLQSKAPVLALQHQSAIHLYDWSHSSGRPCKTASIPIDAEIRSAHYDNEWLTIATSSHILSTHLAQTGAHGVLTCPGLRSFLWRRPTA